MTEKKFSMDDNLADEMGVFADRISQIRLSTCGGSNRVFSQKTGIDEATSAKICSGTRGVGVKMLEKIVLAFPDINARWLLTGHGDMTKNQQRVGDISNSSVSGVNVNGNDIQINPDAYNTLLEMVEKHQMEVQRFQEQIERMLRIIENKL